MISLTKYYRKELSFPRSKSRVVLRVITTLLALLSLTFASAVRADCNFFSDLLGLCSAGESLEKSAKEFSEALKEVGVSAERASANFDPLRLGELMDANVGLNEEVLKLQEILNTAVLGQVSLKPGSSVVFDVTDYTGSFELGAWIGEKERVENRFVFDLTYPKLDSKIFANRNIALAECEAKGLRRSSPWLTRGCMPGLGIGVQSQQLTAFVDEANARFSAALTGNKFGVSDPQYRNHTISLRTSKSGSYPVWMQIKPLTDSWMIVYRIYELKDGTQEQLAIGEIKSENYNVPIGEKGRPIEVAKFKIFVPQIAPQVSLDAPAEVTLGL